MKHIEVNSIDSLSFEGSWFGYESSKPVFHGLSAELPLSRNILVTGAAGNGQSTLLKLIAVLVQPQQGCFKINGHNTTDMSFEEFLPFRKRIGYSFDFGGLFANRTLHDNLTLPLMYHKICSPEEAGLIARDLATKFAFGRQQDQRPASVSGGLRKLVSVLRAFILKPEMVVMDDPFTGVDPESVRKLIRMMQERRESGELRHVFFTSRDEVWPERLGYDALVVENGELKFEEKSGAGKVA